MTQMRKLSVFKYGLLIALMVPLFFLVSVPATAGAATAENCSSNSSGFLGFPTWYKYLTPTFENDECKLSLPKLPGTDKTDAGLAVGLILAAVIEILLRISVLVAIGFVVAGGIKFISAQGEPEKLAKARHTVVNALIGLAIAIASTGLVSFVAGRFV